MNDEIDIILTSRVKECVADKHLPSDFTERVIRSVRRRHRLFRAKAIALVVAAAIGGVCLWEYLDSEPPKRSAGAQLIATKNPTKDAQVSCWMLLGVFHECCKRGRTGKRKEDE